MFRKGHLRYCRGIAAAVMLTLAWPSMAGSLTASQALSPAQIDLSAEGTSDWTHWALTSSSDFNRRIDGANQISDFSVLGGANPTRITTTVARYTWSDGTPTQSVAITRTAARIFNPGLGFALSVPADTDTRTLKVYVGVNRALADFTVTLSDGSAAPVTIQLDQDRAKRSHVVTVDYAADSAGETLDITFMVLAQNSPGGWITLDAATLAGGTATNLPPVIDTLPDQTITEGDLFEQAVSAIDSDGPSPLSLSQSNNLPGAPNILTDNGAGSGQLNWQSAEGDAAGSPYLVTVSATDAAAASSNTSFSLTVLPAGGGAGSLSGSSADAAFITNLTSDGAPDDWVHWGRLNATAVDRKAGVVQQISNYSPFGGATPSRFVPTDARYRWFDGTPLASTNRTRSGVRVFTEDRGFTLSVPADTVSKTLRLYVGVNLGVGELTAVLSDGSAAPFVTEVTDAANKSSFLITLQYAAATAGQTLNLTYQLKTAFSETATWASLESASLTGSAPSNSAPAIDALVDQTLQEGHTLQLAVSATDADGPAPLVLTETNNLPGSPSLMSDNGDGTGQLDWQSDIGDASGSPYVVTVRATDDAGAFSEESFEVAVTPGGTGGEGVLAGIDMIAPSQVSLTAVGDSDWVHWARATPSSVDRKVGGGSQISDYSPIDGALPGRVVNLPTAYSWSDGTPTVADSGTRSGLRVFNPGKGFALSAPADSNSRVIRIYVGANRAVGELVATLSDGSAPPYTVQLSSLNAKTGFVVTLTYSATAANATLDLEYTMFSESSPSAGWVSLESAALSLPVEFQLPYAESFDGELQNWVILDEAGVSSDWSTGNGEYSQANAMGFNGTAMNGAAQVGTYSYASMATGLTNYRVSVMARATAASAQDIGLMARIDPTSGDYIRLSLSGANSFARLENKTSGSFEAVVSNAVGIVPDQWVNLELVVDGDLMSAHVDGQPLFAGVIAGPAAGSVGLYCRDACSFDDLLIAELGSAPEIVIGMPAASTVRGSASFTVSAVAHNLPLGGDVLFSVAGVTDACDAATQTQPGYFVASCNVAADGFYTLDAEMVNGVAAVVDTDTRVQVGVGSHYLSLGNSITAGLDDTTKGDAVAANGTVRGVQGFQAQLTDYLEAEGQTAVVSNSGVPGDTSVRIATERISGVLQRHDEATHVLLTVGVNDAGGAMFTPSGLGCGIACAGTFAGYVQATVAAATAAGKTVVVATTPPRFGDPLQVPHPTPETHPQNVLIRNEYNEVIKTQLANVTVGPDFYDFFLGTENRFYLYETNLHPNALGYRAMAHLFNQSLTGNTDTLFFATGLCVKLLPADECMAPLSYKQNLLESGGTLYVDDSYTLTGSVPAVLAEGRWLQTADADRNQSNVDYLSFELSELASIYVAYDDAASSIPAWLNGYSDTGATISTDNPAAPTMRLYELAGQIGSIALPGADAVATGAGANYLVILVAN